MGIFCRMDELPTIPDISQNSQQYRVSLMVRGLLMPPVNEFTGKTISGHPFLIFACLDIIWLHIALRLKFP